eukprot:scaffold703_cov245-Pinguiococcus_pyrenoidosus.AAC.13
MAHNSQVYAVRDMTTYFEFVNIAIKRLFPYLRTSSAVVRSAGPCLHVACKDEKRPGLEDESLRALDVRKS